jgi:hypothetical protein
MGARLSPKRFVAVVSGILTLYSFARIGVLFFEALAVVRDGRAEDYELIEVCQRGDARGSAKMREACLKARAELASPVVFKAIVQAVSVAFKDFSDTVGSPFKFGVMLLFVVSSVMMPIMPWVRALFGTPVADIQPMNGIHYISYAPPPDNRGRLRRVGSKVMRKLKLRGNPTIEEPDYDDDDARFTEMEPGVPMGDGSAETAKPGWTAIDIMGGFGGMPFGGGGRPASPSGHAKYD